MTNCIDKSERISDGIHKSFQNVNRKIANRSCKLHQRRSLFKLVLFQKMLRGSMMFSCSEYHLFMTVFNYCCKLRSNAIY